uniref:Uncharacterized protein n=1 Tax=Oryza barthii TaxID=65489 RepID=A0A0D3FUY7_9ORYZ
MDSPVSVSELMRREQENAGATSALLPPPPSAVPIAGHLRLPLGPPPPPRRRCRQAQQSLPPPQPPPCPSPRVSFVAIANGRNSALRCRRRNGDGHRADDGGCAMGRRRRYRCNATFGCLLLVTSPSGYWNSGSCGGSTQMLIEMVLDLGAVVLNCRESDHEFVVTVNIFLALRGLLWFLSHGNVFLVMVFVKKKKSFDKVSLSVVISGAWHMTYLWQLNIDAAPLQMMMEKELMSEIKVMDMVWNCKFFGTPLLFMDITILVPSWWS